MFLFPNKMLSDYNYLLSCLPNPSLLTLVNYPWVFFALKDFNSKNIIFFDYGIQSKTTRHNFPACIVTIAMC